MDAKLIQVAKLIQEWAIENNEVVAAAHILDGISCEMFLCGKDEEDSFFNNAREELETRAAQ